MSSKKKLIISLCSFAFVCVAAIIGVVSVLAAKTTTVNNQYSITYTASNVKATVEATYAVGDNAATALKSGEATTLTFTGTEDSSDTSACTKSFDAIGSLTLNEDESLVFVYTIKNTDTTGGASFSVKLSENPDTANDNLTYAYSVKVGEEAATTGTYNSLVSSLAPQATVKITVTISIEDRDLNVNLTNKSLAFVLERV